MYLGNIYTRRLVKKRKIILVKMYTNAYKNCRECLICFIFSKLCVRLKDLKNTDVFWEHNGTHIKNFSSVFLFLSSKQQNMGVFCQVSTLVKCKIITFLFHLMQKVFFRSSISTPNILWLTSIMPPLTARMVTRVLTYGSTILILTHEGLPDLTYMTTFARLETKTI